MLTRFLIRLGWLVVFGLILAHVRAHLVKAQGDDYSIPPIAGTSSGGGP